MKVVSEKKRSPWWNTMLKKIKCRKAERRRWETNLQVYYEICKERLCKIYKLELRNARQSFFSDIITRNNNNTRVLFATVDRLTNHPVSVAFEMLSVEDAVASFFTNKTGKTRQAVSASLLSPRYPTTPQNSSHQTIIKKEPPRQMHDENL